MNFVRWLALALNVVVFGWMIFAFVRDPGGPTATEDKMLILVLFLAAASSIAVMIDLLFLRRR